MWFPNDWREREPWNSAINSSGLTNAPPPQNAAPIDIALQYTTYQPPACPPWPAKVVQCPLDGRGANCAGAIFPEKRAKSVR